MSKSFKIDLSWHATPKEKVGGKWVYPWVIMVDRTPIRSQRNYATREAADKARDAFMKKMGWVEGVNHRE